MEINNQKRTIVLVSNNYTPYSGGVVSSIQLLMDQLLKEGHSVWLVTLDFDPAIQDPPYVLRIPSYYTFDYKMNRMAIAQRPKKYLEQIIEKLKPDIIHVHHPFLLGVLAAQIARKMLIPIIFTYHTRYEDYSHYVPLIPQWSARWLIKQRVRAFCSLVDMILVPTQSLKDELKNAGIKKIIEVVPTALSEAYFSHYSKRELQWPIKLLTVSRFAPEKNLYFLIDLFAQLDHNHYHFTLVGYGALEISLRKYAYEKCGISHEKLRFVIKPTKNELRELYRSCDIFLFSSKTETQGLVLAEALAAGMPLIALKAPGANEAIESGVNGYLLGTMEEMKSAIEQIAENNAIYSWFSQNAFAKAQNYAPSKWIQKIISVYQQLIRSNGTFRQQARLPFEHVK